ncbi:MAG: cell division inhibitor [Flavobacteriaceae bacterium]|nr:cell division inhibitor [Flavobacteriaceae bacterium]
MKIYQKKSSQKIPISKKKAWDFFSDPSNLKIITPKYMGFKIIDGDDKKIFPGQIIEYQVSPLLGIPVKWVTEITHVIDEKYFVDEQRFGPYALWHHKHFIKEINGGIVMDDIIHYKLPFGVIGQIAHPIIVKPKLDEIFNYRYKKLIEIFGEFDKTESYTRNESLNKII